MVHARESNRAGAAGLSGSPGRRRLNVAVASAAEMDAMNAAIEEEVEDCATFAMNSPDPDPSVAFMHLFTDAYELEDIL